MSKSELLLCVSGLSAMTAASTYDANGNTLSDPSGKSYSWDFENRLTQAVVPGTNGGTTTFKYDPLGRRIQKGGPLGTTNYLYDGYNSIEEADSAGNVIARYLQGAHVDEPFAEVRSGTNSYYQQDGFDSVTSLTNSTGSLANSYTYDSYGRLIGSTGALINPFQYTSREFDPETGIYFYRARYYDQNVGHFISEDPIGLGGGTHFYKYARNNPVLYDDPFGLWYNSGQLAPPDKNTIVCNGLGGISVQLAYDVPPDWMHCLYTCLWAHEERHWKDAIAANPSVCYRAAAGAQVMPSTYAEINASEYAAYTVEINCLKGTVKHGTCDKCKQIIKDRINQITPLRNGYK